MYLNKQGNTFHTDPVTHVKGVNHKQEHNGLECGAGQVAKDCHRRDQQGGVEH